MSSIVGFTLLRQLPPDREREALETHRRALRHFPALEQDALSVGGTSLHLWGLPGFRKRISRGPDGTTAVLIGSPHGMLDWNRACEPYLDGQAWQRAVPSWDGRTVALRLQGDGLRWDLWNDWTGSIPVFHARIDDGWVVSTFEPVVVAAGGFSARQISTVALVGLLVDGNFREGTTLFDGMDAVPADCHATWEHDRFAWSRLWTVAPSTDRWETAWEPLVDELHEVATEAVRQALAGSSRWLLPLSGGLDSRLVAAIGSRLGLELTACSWGGKTATDAVYGKAVAKELRLPWRRVDLGTAYLASQFQSWTDAFGSSMHAHGMYQLEFFERVRDVPAMPVVSGFLGDTLSGAKFEEIVDTHERPDLCQLQPDDIIHWTVNEAVALLRAPTADAVREIRADLQRTLAETPGGFFQRSVMLELRHRQQRFTSFSPLVADYERGCVAPFIARDYARFCLSLPRAAMERHLWAALLRKYYPRLAAIPGSYDSEPYLRTGRYLLKRRLASYVPIESVQSRFKYVTLTMDLECARALGWAAVWPINAAWQHLEQWLDMGMVSRVAEQVFSGRSDIRGIRRLQSVQTLAHRLLDPRAGQGPSI